MNKKVSIKEIVGNKIVYSIIIASYYWMWARSDWKNWYDELQVALVQWLADIQQNILTINCNMDKV